MPNMLITAPQETYEIGEKFVFVLTCWSIYHDEPKCVCSYYTKSCICSFLGKVVKVKDRKDGLGYDIVGFDNFIRKGESALVEEVALKDLELDSLFVRSNEDLYMKITEYFCKKVVYNRKLKKWVPVNPRDMGENLNPNEKVQLIKWKKDCECSL